MTIFELFQYNAFAFYGVVALVSLMVGSFLNVVIHRLPIMMERAWHEGMEEFATGSEDNAETSTEGSSNTLEPAETAEPFNLAVPRSRCPSCGSEIKAWQNIPVISYLLLGGKCANCRTPISIRYPIVEFVTMLLSLIVAWQFGPTPQAALGIVVTWFFVSMTMIDIDHQLLPDSLTLPLMWIGLLAAL